MLPPLLALLLGAALPCLVAAAEQRLASADELSRLDAVAVRIARAGRVAEVLTVIDIAQHLGLPADDATDLVARCNRDLANAGKRKGRLAAEAKLLRRLAEDLSQRLPALDADDATRLARQLIRIDEQSATAHQILGHELFDGVWQPTGAAERHSRRMGLGDALQAARHLPVDVAVTPCDDVFAAAILGDDALTARAGGLTLHTQWSAEKAARCIRETARAMAFLNGAIKDTVAAPAFGSPQIIHLPTLASYQSAIERLERDGRLRGAAAQNARRLTGWQVDPTLTVMFRHTESSLNTSMLARCLDGFVVAESKMTARSLPPTLRAAIESWTCLTYFGAPMTGRVFFDGGEMTTKREAGGSSAPLQDEQRREHDEIMRMPGCGIVGTRTYMAYLVARGEDPKWSQTMKDQLGEISGPGLLKTTLVWQFLMESGPVAPLLARIVAAQDDAASQAECLEHAIQRPLDQLEQEWRAWISPTTAGVATRLSSSDDDASSDVEEVLAHLNELRALALGRVDGAGDAVSHDDVLAEGCLAHARYLNQNRDQAEVWPGIHEELLDREGFSTEGAFAAAHSVIATRVRAPNDAVDAWMGGFYHRLPLLMPGLIRIGFALESSTAVLDAKSLRAEWPETFTVVWPANKMDGVPRGFSPEMPNPVPGEDQRRFGYCVTVQRQARFKEDVAARATLTLREGGPQGDLIEGFYTAPDEPRNPDLAPDGAYAFIPAAKLKANTTYFAHFQIGDERPVGWSFTTGKR